MFLATVRFFFNDAATPGIYTYGHTLSLHDALPFFLNLRAWAGGERHRHEPERGDQRGHDHGPEPGCRAPDTGCRPVHAIPHQVLDRCDHDEAVQYRNTRQGDEPDRRRDRERHPPRSAEHTSELQSIMRISYAVFCMNTKNHN